MNTALGTVLITEDEIRRRITDMGRQISNDFAGRGVTFVGILKGSFIFLADLIRAVSSEIPVEVDFMSVSSYGDATTTSGTIHIEKDLGISIEDKDIIIVEDIVDTGLTLLHVYNILSSRGARSLRVATLLEKPGNSKYDKPLDYVGFRIPNKFVVGFGLDFAQRYRNLPEIRVLDEGSECKPDGERELDSAEHKRDSAQP
jgi:hypoxanthine phosphoribosyltransferase